MQLASQCGAVESVGGVVYRVSTVLWVRVGVRKIRPRALFTVDHEIQGWGAEMSL